MNTTRFTFTLADSAQITSVVQGCGGLLRDADRLAVQVRRARAGDALGIYEPLPGHVRLYPHYDARGNGAPIDLDLREVVRVEQEFTCSCGAGITAADQLEHYRNCRHVLALAAEQFGADA